jgi:hypothetical protein
LRAFAAMPVVVFRVRLNALMVALDVSEVALGNAKQSDMARRNHVCCACSVK